MSNRFNELEIKSEFNELKALCLESSLEHLNSQAQLTSSPIHTGSGMEGLPTARFSESSPFASASTPFASAPKNVLSAPIPEAHIRRASLLTWLPAMDTARDNLAIRILKASLLPPNRPRRSSSPIKSTTLLLKQIHFALEFHLSAYQIMTRQRFRKFHEKSMYLLSVNMRQDKEAVTIGFDKFGNLSLGGNCKVVCVTFTQFQFGCGDPIVTSVDLPINPDVHVQEPTIASSSHSQDTSPALVPPSGIENIFKSIFDRQLALGKLRNDRNKGVRELLSTTGNEESQARNPTSKLFSFPIQDLEGKRKIQALFTLTIEEEEVEEATSI